MLRKPAPRTLSVRTGSKATATPRLTPRLLPALWSACLALALLAPASSHASAGVGDTWDFRNHEEQQVVVGMRSGSQAVLGTTESAEPSDPRWESSPVADSGGQTPTVLAFDGDDDVTTLPDVAGLDLSSGFAFEAWLWQSERTSFGRLIDKRGLQFYVNDDGTLQAYVRNTTREGGPNGNGIIYARSQDSIRLSTWTHVGLTYDVDTSGARLSIFVNGEEVDYIRQDLFGADDNLELDGTASEAQLGNNATSAQGFAGLVAYAGITTSPDGQSDWNTSLFAVAPPLSEIHETWDFRNHDGQQVITGSQSGARALLGTTDAAEPADPTWVPSPVPDSNGQPPAVLAFDGGEDVVSLPDLGALDFSSGFAYETWIRQEERTAFARILEKGGLRIFINGDGTLQASARNTTGEGGPNGNGVIRVRSANGLPLNHWRHVGLWYDVTDTKATLRIFLNGQEATYALQDSYGDEDDTDIDVGGSAPLLGNSAGGNRGFSGLLAYGGLEAPVNDIAGWHTDLFPIIKVEPPVLPEYALDQFELRIVLGDERARLARRPQVQNPVSGRWTPVPVDTDADGSTATAEVERRYLTEDGSLNLRLFGSHLSRTWLYLLPVERGGTSAQTDESTDFKARAIAYTRVLGDENAARGLVLNQNSHSMVPEFDPDGRVSSLTVDGEELSGVQLSNVATGGLTPVDSSVGADSGHFKFLHGGANPVDLSIERHGDRLRYTYEYTVEEPIDEAVEITTKLTLPGDFATLESLNWRRDHEFTTAADPDRPLAMAQLPFVLARSVDGAYVGVLDHNSSSLVSRLNESDNALQVEQWIWPKRAGQKYMWEFDVLAGYEAYDSALLRALNPHTKEFNSNLRGAILNRGVLDSPKAARDAYDSGVRAVWLHGWFYRNGLYFRDGQPMDEEYESIWGDIYSYQRLKEQVENARTAGLEVYVYFQFAGVSEDISDQFATSLVRDPDGEVVVAGADGGISNLWANPNPDGVYGQEVLEQVDRMLGVIEPDGVALDRADRLDFAYGTGYDYGAFDGHASPRLPGAEPQPASSITYQGKRFMTELRDILDQHDAKVIGNLTISPSSYQLSDGTLIDQPMTPWKLFFMRGSSNGKPFFIIDTSRTVDSDAESECEENRLLARLTRSQPYLSVFEETPEGGLPESCRLPEPAANSRLQYVVPTDAGYPAIWLFDDGTAYLRYDGTEPTVPDKFAGSEFVPFSSE